MRTAARFAGVGLASFLLDTAVLWLLQAATGQLVVAVVGARVVSGAANFIANRRCVFAAQDLPWRPALVRYLALAGLLLGSAVLMSTLTGLGLPVLAAKVVTDVVLFCCSLLGQRLVVFARPAVRLRPAAVQRPRAVRPVGTTFVDYRGRASRSAAVRSTRARAWSMASVWRRKPVSASSAIRSTSPSSPWKASGSRLGRADSAFSTAAFTT